MYVMKPQISIKYGHIAGEYEGENSFLCYGICSTNGLETDKTKPTFFLVDIAFWNLTSWAEQSLTQDLLCDFL